MAIIVIALCLLQVALVRADADGIAGFPTGIAVYGAKAAAVPLGCSQFAILVNYCESATPGFDNLRASQQASCICYSSSSWIPNYFDGAVAECASWAQTSDTTDYSDIHALESFCTHQGNVAAPKTTGASTTGSNAGPTTAKATTSGGAVATGGASACSSITAAVSSCEAATSGFIDMSGSKQASCICYSGGSWSPDIFDGPVHTCAMYLSTANPSQYSGIVSLESFCTKKGDVRANTATSLAATGSATRSAVVVQSNPPTPSIGTDGASSSSTSTTPTQAVVVVTVQASTSATLAPAKSGGVASRSLEGTLVLLGVSLVLAAAGMCVLL